jgi:hypothetical protein
MPTKPKPAPVQLPEGFTSITEGLPPTGKRVLVACLGYRLLGYVDAKGQWWTDARNEPLKEVIGWRDLASP